MDVAISSLPAVSRSKSGVSRIGTPSSMRDRLSDDLFTSREAAAISGASYRQIDYWCRVGSLPSARRARGTGTQRRFTAEQVVVARVLWQLSQLGATQPIWTAVAERLLLSNERWNRFVVVAGDGTMRQVVDVDDLRGGYVVDLAASVVHVQLAARQQQIA